MYLATERGYFEERGISPQFVTFDSAARAIPALSNGDIDVAAGVLSAGLFNAVDRGIDIRIVMPQSQSSDCAHSSTWLLVRKDLFDSGAIQTPADLRGRTVALVSKSSTVEYVVDALLSQGNLGPLDVEKVELSFGDMGAAFGSRAIDVAVGSEPTATGYVDKGLAVRWRCAAEIVPNIQYTYVLYSPRFAIQRADVATRWMAAYLRGATDWQRLIDTAAGRADASAVLSKYTPLRDPAILEHNLAIIPSDGPIDIGNIRKQLQWARDRGYVTRDVGIDAMVDTRVVESARELNTQLGGGR